MFSERTGWDRESSPLAIAAAVRRRQGLPMLDLTASNPTRCGFAIDVEALLQPLTDPGALVYAPQPFGSVTARQAVARYYAERGAELGADRLCLTTGTSEGYSYLLRLLCNAGDEVLIASPTYPLFDYLAELADVRLVRYPLVYEHGWQLAPGQLERRITPRTRAVALVHPNNPTGHSISATERDYLEQLCVAHDLALIVDEVFLDYPWTDTASGQSFAVAPHPALTFVLSGLSKIAGLPQMKLGWVGVLGPQGLRDEALARLEVIADTFLSGNAPVQAATPAWLAHSGRMREQILERVCRNLAELDRGIRGTAVSRLIGEAGWYAVLRVPALEDDEAMSLRLLAEHGVLVHPGSAFGFPAAGWMVVSLLTDPEMLRAGVSAVVSTVSPQH